MADEKVEKTAAVVPLSVSEKMKKARAAPPLHVILWALFVPDVRDVILWSLLNAGIYPLSFAIGTAYYMLITTTFCHQASWLLPSVGAFTDAEVTMVCALMDWLLWCAAPQAAAAAVAPMLPRHRRRLRITLAYAALLATFASHCMMTGMMRIYGAEPGVVGLFFRTVGTAVILFLGVVDLGCFLGLVLRGGEE